MQLRAIFATLAASFVLVAACSSEGEVGESCEKEGDTEGQCTNAGVCGKNKSGALVCLRRCIDYVHCPEGEVCESVPNSDLKGCRASR